MKYVYIVVDYSYDISPEDVIHKVFSSKELAEEYIKGFSYLKVIVEKID